MENFRYVIANKKLFVIGGTLFVLPFFAFGYSDTTTHPALTQEILKFYNESYSYQQINNEDAQEIIQGSVDEDSGTRWLYHFYDPVYNRGLVLDGSLTTEELSLAFVAGGPKSKWKSSKDWAENTLLQGDREYSLTAGILTDLFTSDNDYSWERAIYDYAWKDKKRGLQGLGHILHLLEDKTVPDHTRNDPHPHITELFSITNASPYEVWTKKFDRTTINIKTLGEKPTEFDNLAIYFDALANQSNKNFFSEDTILSVKYTNPTIEKESIEILNSGIGYKFAYAKDNDGRIYPVAKVIQDFADKTKHYTLKDPENYVLGVY